MQVIRKIYFIAALSTLILCSLLCCLDAMVVDAGVDAGMVDAGETPAVRVGQLPLIGGSDEVVVDAGETPAVQGGQLPLIGGSDEVVVDAGETPAVRGGQLPLIGSADEGWYFRYDLLQMLLEERGLRVVASIESAFSAPRESVIVIAGDRPALSANAWGNVVGYILDGGTILLATDSSFTLAGLGQFSKGPVTTNRSSDQYQGFEDCLRIAPNVDAAGFSGVSQIITNRSGWFTPNSLGWLEWEVLAALPSDCRPLAGQQRPLLAIGRWGSKDAGLGIVSADASLFSNGMLWHGDNAVAAIRVSELLCASGEKTQLVFLADGEVLDSYRNRIMAPSAEDVEAMEDRQVPEPELKKALRLANAIAKEVAKSNILNEALRQRPRGMPPSRYFRGLLYLVAVMFLVVIVWALLVSGVLRPLFMAPRKMRSAYEMREFANSHANDFRHSAGYLARDFCWELTGSRLTADWQKFLAESLAETSLHSQAELQELTRIIDIACRGCHTRMASHEFQLLGKSISILRAKHRVQPLTA